MNSSVPKELKYNYININKFITRAENKNLELKVHILDRVEQFQTKWWLEFYRGLYSSWNLKIAPDSEPDIPPTLLIEYFKKVRLSKTKNNHFSKFGKTLLCRSEIKRFFNKYIHYPWDYIFDDNFKTQIEPIFETLLAFSLVFNDGYPMTLLNKFSIYHFNSTVPLSLQYKINLCPESVVFIQTLWRIRAFRNYKKNYTWKFMKTQYLVYFINSLLLFDGVASRITSETLNFNFIDNFYSKSGHFPAEHLQYIGINNQEELIKRLADFRVCIVKDPRSVRKRQKDHIDHFFNLNLGKF
ncbi:MAG: hypothetical protein R8N23_06595 [Reichenbachiella sp.]|uniref:hypothetical protein n=1 Tax=Reichenbachiella sp. TaxID=2184521 RepID=UPI00296704C3|nr:hypothetical protein [Reichenbachiella sp.]MDW3209513.1 hypothetical protein [Reichenbachiella sp.]